MKAIPRAFTAAMAAGAISLALWSGAPTRAAASPQATPMPSPVPTPMATPISSPMPNPAVTPAGNPVPTAPSPGTDMLNNNPNGNWLDKFNRTATPDPGTGMRAPVTTAAPAMSARCRTMWKMAKTSAQRAKVKAQCGLPR